MKQILSSGLAVALFILTGASYAQAQSQPANPNRDSMLVTVDWLAAHLNDPSLVLLEIGELDEYAKRHIPGALHMRYGDIATSNGSLAFELPPVEQLVSVFENLGVSYNSHVVLYLDDDFSPAVTRVYWTLDYLGLGDRTSILDGSLRAWRDAGKSVTSDSKQPARGSIRPPIRPEVVADAAWVRSHMGQPGITLVDARKHVYYGWMWWFGGHIPGATNLPIEDLVDGKTGKLKPPDELKSLFQAAGLKPGNLMVSYCHIGYRATLVYFAARLLGYDAKMYDGSMQDWSQRNLPVVSGGAPGKP